MSANVTTVCCKITSMTKIILGGHPVALVGQAKHFHQHHIWCFPLPCTGGKISLNAMSIPCNDQLWCPHMQHSWHLILWSMIIYFPPPFSKNGSDCAVGNLHIYAPKLDWLNGWMADSNCIAIKGNLTIKQTLQTMSMSDIYGIYMRVWMDLNVMAYMMKNDWEVVKSLTV